MMISAGPMRAAAPLPPASPQSCYDMEVEVLHRDLIDMNSEMDASVRQATDAQAQTYQRERAMWESKIEARATAMKATAARLQAVEHEAMARYHADTLEVERLNQHEIVRLRQRMPRAGRAPRIAPAPRPHRTCATRMCKPPAPTPASLARARDIYTWLHVCGIQQRHAQGQPFIDALCKGPLPEALRGVSAPKLLALHLELSALPAAAWSGAISAMARVLDGGASGTGIRDARASDAGTLDARVGSASQTWFKRLMGLWVPRPLGWSWIASHLWPANGKS